MMIIIINSIRRFCDGVSLFVGWFVRSFIMLVLISWQLQVRFSQNWHRRSASMPNALLT